MHALPRRSGAPSGGIRPGLSRQPHVISSTGLDYYSFVSSWYATRVRPAGNRHPSSTPSASTTSPKPTTAPHEAADRPTADVAPFPQQCEISRTEPFRKRHRPITAKLCPVGSRTGRGRVTVARAKTKAKPRKGYYRAAHYVKPSSASSRWKKPSTGLVLAGVVVVIAAWNTLFSGGSDHSDQTPRPQPSSASASAVPGH